MDTISDILANVLSFRQDYRRFKLQESSILLFFRMSEPVGTIAKFNEKLNTVQVKNMSFHYPTTYSYETDYMHLMQNFFSS